MDAINKENVASVQLIDARLSEDELSVYEASLSYVLATLDAEEIEQRFGATRDEIEGMRDDLRQMLPESVASPMAETLSPEIKKQPQPTYILRSSARIKRRGDFFLFADIKAGNAQIKDVLCETFLPKESTKRPMIYFYPTEDQAAALKYVYEFSVHGVIQSLRGPIGEIQADLVYSLGFTTHSWEPKITEYSLEGEPWDLKVTRFVPREDASPGKRSVHGRFWLTPSVLLSPAQIINRYPDGNVSVEKVRQFSFTFPGHLLIHFDKRYLYSQEEEGKTTVSSDLIAQFEKEVGESGNALDLQGGVLPRLDDFLMLVSLAARQRTACPGWELFETERYTTHYRRHITIPPATERHDLEETLIDIALFEDFMTAAYGKFLETEPKEFLRQTIHRIIPRERETIENSFATLYSALESVISHFRQKHQLKRILPGKKWNQFQNELQQWVEANPLLEGEDERKALITEKILELNRVSFSTAYNRFCEVHSLDMSDLWPVVGGDKGPSLSTIRNRLLHGEVFNPLQTTALIAAKQHLQWTLERIILTLLGWPVAKSKVRKQYLKHMTAYRNMEAARDILAKST